MYVIAYTKVLLGNNESEQWESNSSRIEVELKGCKDKKEAIKKYERFKRGTLDYLSSFGKKVRTRCESWGLFKKNKEGKLIHITT